MNRASPQELLVHRLHALPGDRAGVLAFLLAPGAETRILARGHRVRREAVENAARPELLPKFGIRRVRIVGVLRLLLGVEMVEVAEKLVEAVHRRQEFVAVAQMVLAELAGDVALRLQELGERRILVGQALLGRRQADLEQAGADRALAGDEGGPARRAGLLGVIVGEDRALVGDAIDVGRAIAHHAAVVGADVPVADVVAHDDENVGLLRVREGRRRERRRAQAERQGARRFPGHVSSLPMSSRRRDRPLGRPAPRAVAICLAGRMRVHPSPVNPPPSPSWPRRAPSAGARARRRGRRVLSNRASASPLRGSLAPDWAGAPVAPPRLSQTFGSSCAWRLKNCSRSRSRGGLVGEIVEHEVAAVGLHREHRMALAIEVAHDRHQQRLARKAAFDQELALEQGVDLAVALAVDRIVPMVEHGAPMVEVADRLDRAVDAALTSLSIATPAASGGRRPA